MTQAERPAPVFLSDHRVFLADHRALDFLNSVAAPWGAEIEWLGDGRDFLAWLTASGLVPDEALTRFRREVAPAELNAVAARARELRAWFRAFVHNHAGQPLQPSVLGDLDVINDLLARDDTYRQIEARGLPEPDREANGPALHWRQERRWHSVDALLLPLAEVIGDLICHADFTQVKHCEGPTCTMWFHDVSKNHTRRWCSMAVCGNRAKAAAHRAKKRSARSAQC